jgi:hypothetical protein
MYLYEWFLTIFSRSLPLDISSRIFDNFFIEGINFLYRTALGLIRMNRTKLLNGTFEGKHN